MRSRGLTAENLVALLSASSVPDDGKHGDDGQKTGAEEDATDEGSSIEALRLARVDSSARGIALSVVSLKAGVVRAAPGAVVIDEATLAIVVTRAHA